MRIVLDGRMLYWTGVGRYTQALLRELEELDHDNEYIVLTRPADKKLWEPKAANFRRLEVNIDPYSLKEQLELPRLLRGLNPDLVHFLAVNSPVLYRGRKVVTVHDLILLDYDTSRGSGMRRWIQRLKRLPFRLVVWAQVRSAAYVLTPTRYVKHDIEHRFRVDKAKVVAVALAADSELAKPAPIDHLGVGDNFLLYVGNVYPYKTANGITLEALKKITQDYPTLKLVMTAKADYFRDQLEEKARQLGLEDRIVFTGFVSNGELVSLYRNAKVYVYASLAEGFGLQGLEAMTQGCTVLAAQATCLPEVCGEAAMYFDPSDADDLAKKLRILLDDEHKRNELRAAGYERVKQFSWQKTAAETLSVYLQALKQK